MFTSALNCIFAFIFILIISSSSQANFVGNDTNNFNPTPGGLDFITVHSSETLENGLLNINLFYNYAANTLPDTIDSKGLPVHYDDKISFGDFSLGYGVSDRFELGLTLSTLLDQQTNRSSDGSQFSATGLNEIRILSKYRFIKSEPTGLAATLSANINEAQNSPFAGVGSGPTLNVQGVLDHRFGQVLMALNLGYRFRQNGTPVQDSVFDPLPDQWIGSLAANYYFAEKGLKLVTEIYAAKSSRSTRNVSQDHIASEGLIGLKYDAFSNTSIQGGWGARIGEGLFTPTWRAFLGVSVNFAILEKKEDPKKILIVEPVGASVSSAEVVESVQELERKSFDDLTKVHEFYLRTAIPENETDVSKAPFEIVRLQNFDFEFGSADIKANLQPTLNRLAHYLKSSDVVKIRIEGHTDSLGSSERNRIISQLRADRVKEYLSQPGLLPDLKIEAVGYGSDRPIADNGNFQGRRQNRRVEVRVIRR